MPWWFAMAPAGTSQASACAYLRSNKLASLVWDSYDDILAACAEAWRFLTDDPDRIQSIGYRNWASVSR